MLNCNYTCATSYNFGNEICDVSPNINYVGVASNTTLETALNCNSVTTDKWVQLFIPKIVDIPTQKPDMEGIISLSSCIDIISQRVVRTPAVTGYTTNTGVFIPGNEIPNSECTNLTGKKLIIEGILTEKVVYTALVSDQALHSATFKIPFSTFIIVDGNVALSQQYQVVPYFEDAFAHMLSERSVFTNITLFIKANQIC